MLIVFPELTGPLEPLSPHVRFGVPPHGVVPGPVGLHRIGGYILVLSELSSCDEASAGGFLGLL